MIKQETIEEICNTARVEEVVGDYVRLRKSGINYMGLCPFHNEKTPSFIVSPAKGIFKCFGCGVGGDSVGFVMKHEGMSYGDALRYLAKKYSIHIEETERTPEQIKELNEREAIFSTLAFAGQHFCDYMRNSEEGKSLGMTYFNSRGFSDKTIEKFQLGFAPSDRSAFSRHALKNGYTIDNLVNAGLTTVRDDGFKNDRFHGRAIFPIHNFSGKIIAFGGRVLSSRPDVHVAKYINSPETAVYHKSDALYGIFFAKTAIKREDCCLLVEGYTDVISLHQTGIENVTASSGTALTTGQIKLIRKLTDNVTILYDGDSAGVKAALRGVSLLLKEGVNVRVVLLPPDEDPDSFARQHSREECLEYIKDHSQTFIEFKTKLLLDEAGSDPIQKAKVARQISQDIALVKDVMTQTFYIRECSRLMNIPEETLTQTVKQIQVKAYIDERAQKVSAERETEINQAMEEIEANTPAAQNNSLPAQSFSVETVEKAILKLLVNFGTSLVYRPTDNYEETRQLIAIRIDQFIFNDLWEDDIHFENEVYYKFLAEYARLAEEHQQDVVKHLRTHPDEIIRQMSLDLIEIPPQASPQWESDRIKSYIRSIYNDSGRLFEDVIRTILMLKLIKIRKLRNFKINELKIVSQEDEPIILYEFQRLSRKIKELETILGTVYRNLS